MSDDIVPKIAAAVAVMSALLWFVGQTEERQGALTEQVEQPQLKAAAASEVLETARRKLAAQVEEAKEQDSKRKRDAAWDAETRRLQQYARNRDHEYRLRLEREDAEDAIRKRENELARKNEELQQKRLHEETAYRNALLESIEREKALERDLEREKAQRANQDRIAPVYSSRTPTASGAGAATGASGSNARR